MTDSGLSGTPKRNEQGGSEGQRNGHAPSDGNNGGKIGGEGQAPIPGPGRWRKRKLLKPTGVWLIGVSVFLTCAVGAIFAALTVGEEAAVRASVLWVGAGGLALASGLCVLAHFHVNQGREPDEYVIEEVQPGEGR